MDKNIQCEKKRQNFIWIIVLSIVFILIIGRICMDLILVDISNVVI